MICSQDLLKNRNGCLYGCRCPSQGRKDTDKIKQKAAENYPLLFNVNKKARDGTRTRGLDLGKVALHQLSHSRISG